MTAVRTKKQNEAYKYLSDKETNYLAFGGSAGGGKSWLGCEWLMQCCYYLAGTRWFIGRNNIKDTRQSVLVTFGKVAKSHNFTDYKTTKEGIEFGNGSEIIFLDLTFYPYKDPMFEGLGSKEYTGGWIEEAGQVHELAFDVLKSRVGRHLNLEYDIKKKILITCNPKKNWLYSQFYKPSKDGTLEKGYQFIQSLPTDNPFLTKDYLSGLRSIKDKSTKERLLNGNWDYDDDPNALISYAAIKDIFTNSQVMRTGEKYISSDVAALGSDKMVTGVFDGMVMIAKNVLEKNDGENGVKEILKLKLKNQVRNSNIIYDSDGVGSYLGGFIKGAKRFVNNAKAISQGKQIEQYQNLKTQCYFKLAEEINKGNFYIDCELSEKEKEEIIEELGQVKSYKTETDGKLRLQPKSITKSNIGRSPDWTDMFAMRMLFLLKPKPQSRRYGTN